MVIQVRKRAHASARDAVINTMDCKNTDDSDSFHRRLHRDHCKRRRRTTRCSHWQYLASSMAIIMLSYHLPASATSLPERLFTTTDAKSSSTASSGALLDYNADHEPKLMRRRELQQKMEGSCLSSKLEAGQQRGEGSYLCYPTSNPIYKFGIDSSNQLSYYVNDELIWSATPPPPETNECIVFGSCFVPIHYFRLQGAGALVGYDDNRSKAYDSHLHGGEYSDYATEELGMPEDAVNTISGKMSGSTLELDETGVFIIFDDGAGGVVTWKIDAPILEEVATDSPTTKPTNEPTKRPTNKPTTSSPTKSPTKTQLGSIQGFIWDDKNNDGLYNSGDAPLSSIPVSIHQCSDDAYIESAFTSEDGTFAMDNLEEGRYRIRVTPPGGISDNNDANSNSDGASLFNNGSGTGNSDGLWEFVPKNVNDSNNPGSIFAEDSDVNADGTSDCIVVSAEDATGALQHSVYVGMTRSTGIEEEDAITVSGSIFWDDDSNGSMDDGDTTTDATSSAMVNNVVVDLYTCPTNSAETPEWILLTRTDTSGKYEFTTPQLDGNGNGATSTNDITSLLEEKGVTRFRAVVSLPSGVDFIPTSNDSHIDPENGETPCWNMEVDGKGDIVWNAGLTASDANTAPTSTTTEPTDSTTQQTITAGVIGGYAFLDSNNDGIRDNDTETGLFNINVKLFSCTPPSTPASGAQSFLGHMKEQQSSSDQILAMQRTNNEGFYSFRNLFSGYYRVSIKPLPSTYEVSSVWSGASDGDDDVDNAVDSDTKSTECFQLTGGKTDISWDIGLVEVSPTIDEGVPTRIPSTLAPIAITPVVISGFVFNDGNDDGYLGDGENFMSEVQVALFNCDGGVISLSITDDNGMYGFQNIVPGPYKIKFMSPEGYAISSVWTGQVDEEGKFDAADATNDADPSTGSTDCIEYWEDDFATDAGMYLQSTVISPTAPSLPTPGAGSSPPTPKQTPKPTDVPKGPCSGAACSVDGMCRNKAGLCGKGIGFCNPNSIWEASCPLKDVNSDESEGSGGSNPALLTLSSMPTVTSAPSASSSPSATPTISTSPTLSHEPTTSPVIPPGQEVTGTPPSVCNKDGSVGATVNAVTNDNIVSFTYALRSTNGQPVDPNLVSQFESELHLRMSCVYFDDPCLGCGSGEEQGSNLRRLRSMTTVVRDRDMGRKMEEEVDVSSSFALGMSSLPKDVPNPVEVCIDSAAGNCRVISGKFTAYFPLNMDPSLMEQETNDMLNIVNHEMDKNDWDGMQVSYNNAPFLSIDRAEEMEQDGINETEGGLSTGAIIGIVAGTVILIAIVAVSSILFIRNKREKHEQAELSQQQQQQRGATAVPFGGAVESLSLGSEDEMDDEYESDMDDSDDDSSSSSSSGSEGTSLDDFGSDSNISSPSAISGDLTNVAHARPQDIEEDDEESTDGDSSDEDESMDEESYDIEELEGNGDDNLERLQQEQQLLAVAPVGDQKPHGMYEDEYGGKEYNGGGYDVEDGQGYGNRNYDNGQAVMGEYHNNGYPQSYDDDIDDAASMQSGDPPGTSYRDLPQEQEEEEDWNHQYGMMDGHIPPEQQQQPTQNNINAGVSGFADNGYYDGDTTDSPQGSFKVYEDGSNGLNDSYKSFGQQLQHLDDNQSNISGSHHSNTGSYHSNQSYHSGQSQRSSRSQGSHRSRHSQDHNSHLHDEGMDHQKQLQQQHQQDYDQYAEEGQVYDQEVVDDSNNYLDGDGQYHNQNGEVQQAQYSNEYDQYDMDGGGNTTMGHHGYMDNSRMANGDEGQFSSNSMLDNNHHQYGNPSFPAENAAEAYNDGHGHHGGEGMINDDGFDEESYHSFNPIIPSTNPASLSRPEELDEEVSHAGSAYTAATPLMSNTSSEPTTKSKKAMSNGGEGGGFHGKNSPGQETYGEEEESITNIFKSLSEIQNRLASKGKSPLPEGALAQHDIAPRSKTRKSPGDMYAPANYPVGSGSNNGWGKEGIVEDASVDGSQVSSFVTSVARNRRPQHGQWMEPVDEG